MALESSADAPVPVRTVSRLIGEWVGQLGAVWMEGQVAQFRRRPGARNQFLVLRDTDAEVSLTIVADAQLVGSVEPPLAEGQRVVIWARPEFWSGQGSLQLRARDIRPVGIGDLLASIERLKALLAAEGLFAPERKVPLPFLPHTIGLICGRASAAMTDVLVNVEDRWPGTRFDVREVAVQGVNAVPEITAALAELDADPHVDVIVIARGGGSVEDLLPFSNETLVRAVATARTPVVSAIGHEQDSPLLDYVADLRASTPTDAAKRIVPSWAEESALITGLRDRARRTLLTAIERAIDSIADLRRRSLARITGQWEAATADIDHLSARLRALSPASTLDRGYAIVTVDDGTIVRNERDVAAGDVMTIRVARGSLTARREADDG
ncbi:MAG: exodeoxyribonuclease VII large subunit [Actinobacteria bacterium]|nr:exodeoxyribonuclease VII large subunit [Actinomycetota bacterium]